MHQIVRPSLARLPLILLSYPDEPHHLAKEPS
jgi:hypothetical protein